MSEWKRIGGKGSETEWMREKKKGDCVEEGRGEERDAGRMFCQALYTRELLELRRSKQGNTTKTLNI